MGRGGRADARVANGAMRRRIEASMRITMARINGQTQEEGKKKKSFGLSKYSHHAVYILKHSGCQGDLFSDLPVEGEENSTEDAEK